MVLQSTRNGVTAWRISSQYLCAQTSVTTTKPLSVLKDLECNSVISPTKLFLVAKVKMKKPRGSSPLKVDSRKNPTDKLLQEPSNP